MVLATLDRAGADWLLAAQAPDGSIPCVPRGVATIEETAVAVEALAAVAARRRGCIGGGAEAKPRRCHGLYWSQAHTQLMQELAQLADELLPPPEGFAGIVGEGAGQGRQAGQAGLRQPLAGRSQRTRHELGKGFLAAEQIPEPPLRFQPTGLLQRCEIGRAHV